MVFNYLVFTFCLVIPNWMTFLWVQEEPNKSNSNAKVCPLIRFCSLIISSWYDSWFVLLFLFFFNFCSCVCIIYLSAWDAKHVLEVFWIKNIFQAENCVWLFMKIIWIKRLSLEQINYDRKKYGSPTSVFASQKTRCQRLIIIIIIIIINFYRLS